MVNVYEFLRYQPEIYKQFVCKDLLFVYYYCPQTIRKVDVFTHYNVLAFIMEGKKIIHRPENKWLLEAGHCYFLKTGAYNQELHFGDGWRSMNLYIPDSYLLQFSREYLQNPKQKSLTERSLEQVNELEISEQTRKLSQQMLASFSQEPPPSEAVLEQRFREVFQSILAESGNQFLLNYISSLVKSAPVPLVSVMETNFMYNLSLAEFAQLANLSLPTFKREFKRIFHTTPAQWLKRKRLSYAEALLKTTEKNIGDIVQESGFESAAHFSRVFKSTFGLSPLNYRKQSVIRLESRNECLLTQ